MDLRWYQSEAVLCTWERLCKEPGNHVIVLPTGAGKSLVIAKLCEDVIGWGKQAIVLAHRKELLEQNADKIRRLLPGRKVGLFSAGLRRWDAESPVVCAGIQSCWQKASAFGERSLIVVDEAHLISTTGDGMYRKFLSEIQAINPKSRVVGLTATPYRTGEGSLCGPDKLFQVVSYEAKIPRLIECGFLSPITSQSAEHSANTSGLHIRGGEYIAGEVEQLFGDAATVRAAVTETVAKTRDRKAVIVFCAGVNHAESVAAEIERVTGERVAVVTGNTSPLQRASSLEMFKNGWLRWLVNVDVLTTGFDAPNIDAIAVLRATCSPGLFAQICGRGFRLAPGKINCLILDFGENIKRHGPLDAEDYGCRAVASRGGDEPGDGPTKRCPNCERELAAGRRQCECGFLFPPPGPRHGESAGSDAILASQSPPIKWLVESVNLALWTNRKTGSRTLRVDYDCQRADDPGNLSREVISEWVCLEHDGFAGRKAKEWWSKRSVYPVESIEDALKAWDRGAIGFPGMITARKEGRFWRVLNYSAIEIPTEDEWRGLDEREVEAVDFWSEETGEEVPF